LIAGVPPGPFLDSKKLFQVFHELSRPPPINSHRDPSVYMDKAYMLLAVNKDLGGGSQEGSVAADYKGSNGDE